MPRLFRYLLLESLLPSLISVAVLTGIVIWPRVLQLVDLWVNKGAPIRHLGEMILFILPRFLVGTLPLALLLGILSTLGRLSQDSEIVVMKASGISLYQLMGPILGLVTAFSLVSLYLSTFLVPEATFNFSQVKDALASRSSFTIPPQTFNTNFPGLILFVNERPQSGALLKGILIHDQRNSAQPVTVVAESGVLHTGQAGQALLLLQNGSRHFQKKDGSYQKLGFTTYDLDLGLGKDAEKVTPTRRVEELSMPELAAITQDQDVKRSNKARLEWHSRLANPAATFLLGLLAVPLGIQSHRSGKSYGFVVALAVMIIHFLLISVGETLVKKGTVAPWLGVWGPAMLLAVFTAYVVHQSARERPLRIAVWIANLLANLPERLLRSADKAKT